MTPLSAIWLLVAASGRADDSTTGFAWSAALRVPLVDSADPLPWQGTGRPPVGAMRLDILPGASLNAASGWEADFHARVSGYAMAWADETIQPGHRGGLEVAVRKFVPPNNEREDFGIWTGGYAGGSVMAEVWGRHDPGRPAGFSRDGRRCLGRPRGRLRRHHRWSWLRGAGRARVLPARPGLRHPLSRISRGPSRTESRLSP
jgi:hypothetical protein